MDPHQRDYIQEEYAKIRTLPEGVNPVVKVCVSVWHHQTELHITEVEPMHTGRRDPPPPPAPSLGGAMTAGNDNTVATATQVEDQHVRVQAYNAMAQRPLNQEFFSRFVSLHNQTQQQISQEGRTVDRHFSTMRSFLEVQFDKLNANVCR